MVALLEGGGAAAARGGAGLLAGLRERVVDGLEIGRLPLAHGAADLRQLRADARAHALRVRLAGLRPAAHERAADEGVAAEAGVLLLARLHEGRVGDAALLDVVLA